MVLVGLGNPTNQYKYTRHNVGFLFLDWFSGEDDWKNDKTFNILIKEYSFMSHTDRNLWKLIKPLTYMNDSGVAVSKYVNYYKIFVKREFIVIFDDLDLELGNWKVQKEKGPKVHNGLNSIELHLGTKGFQRIRIGVYNKETRIVNDNSKISGSDYVLSQFTKEEKDILFQKVFPQIRESLSLLISN